MIVQHVHKIHLVQLVTGKDQDIITLKWPEMAETLPHRIRRTLIPGWVVWCLFSSQDVHKCRAECAEMVCIFYMPVQGSRIELREYEHPVDA